MKVKFHKQYVSGKEIEYIGDVIKSGHTKGDGKYSKMVSSFIEEKFGTNKCLLTTSASTALEMAMMIIDLEEGDEVILPSFTFPSTANAVLLHNGKCVFADIDETLNIDLDDVEKKITPRTKAIMPVHYASTSCDMNRLMEIAKKHNIFIIEDAAQAVNAKFENKYLGSIGHLGCYSFHQTKNYSCGEGGALLINTDDEQLMRRAEIIREKGTNRSDFIKGKAKNYSWVATGSSMLPSDILAAHLMAQFEDLDIINDKRKERYHYYYNTLKDLSVENSFSILEVPDYNSSNYHLIYLCFQENETRDDIMKFLNDHGVEAFFHYIPLHTSKKGVEIGANSYLENTEELPYKILRLPLYPDLSFQEIDYVCRLIKEYFSKERQND